MNPTIMAAAISAGSAILVCVINNWFVMKKAEKANKDNIVLISYRLEQLEHKVDKHNNLIERTYELERNTSVLQEKVTVANHRINDLEKHMDDAK